MRPRRRLAALLLAFAVSTGVSGAATWRVLGATRVAGVTSASVASPLLPSVLLASAGAAGLQVHVIPGQYRPTFDTAFTESLPLVTTSADSNPSAAATAAPVDMNVLNHYPDVACVLSISAPYCAQIREFPVNTYFAVASSDSPKGYDSSTSFPCHPGVAAPPEAVLAAPSCRAGSPQPPPLADGVAHADREPAAAGRADLGPLSLGVPAAMANQFTARVQLARTALAALNLDTAGLDRAAASSTLLEAAQTTVRSAVSLGADGVPVVRQSSIFGSIDLLGGLLHFDSLTLTSAVATLGEAHPRTLQETVSITGARVLGSAVGNIDSSNCAAAADAINGSGGRPGLRMLGFSFSCATDSTRITTGAAGFGLNPVDQDLAGPGIDFVQPMSASDVLKMLHVPVPNICYPQPGLPAPPPLPSFKLPVPTPGIPTSSCQFVSLNTLANNSLSIHLGHLTARLAAQPPLMESSDQAPSTLPAFVLSAPPLASSLQPSPGRSHTVTVTTTITPRPVVPASYEVASRRWLLFAFGAWEALLLAFVYIGAAAVHRRRARALRS